ncbi:MAG: HNH endonuclease domain-containing protein [Opitutaceae bacterium]|nr:HNH endonuclease domain-containing protein [Opitutaceae bacterium]
MTASPNPTRLELAFDIGHSSIGWAVLAAPDAAPPSLIGCGTVIFEKDSALANTRRLHRSQRRHVRATRQRIARMEKLLIHLGIFTAAELAAKHRANGGSPTPWLLAARVLASDGKQTLTWPELWDVLRWYAHNRGYEEITGETRDDAEESDEKKQDTEKVENAKAALAQFGKNSMAETICAWLGQDPLAPRTGTTENYKAKNCAFERAFVDAEVTRLLASHLGKLPGVTEALVATLILDARAIGVPSIRLPLRYQGSLLFGRLATRYHNRIIGACPISGEKIPGKNCPEFLRYRWAMQLANLRIADSADTPLRPLAADERSQIHALMVASGSLGVRELKDAVRSLPGHARDNLEQFFLHPDAKEGLVLDPVQKLVTGNPTVSAIWPHLPERLQKRTRGHWRRGKSTNLAKLREDALRLGHDCTTFDAAVDALCAPPKKLTKKTPPPVKEKLLLEPLDARRELAKLSGRAPYARPLLAQAFDEVMAGRDPKATGGCLEETEAVRLRRESRPLPQQTNNHLVRHRLQIFGRLLSDLIADPSYGAGEPARISRVTLEVNRDLREMAGLTAQDIAKELGQRLAGHKKVSARLEAELPPGTVVNAGLIRKARIADDLGWRCPYTGIEFEPKDLIERRVDKDHIIPRSQRATDSLDALAVTFSTINKWKGQRTAWQFVSDEGGKSVPDAPNLCIMPLARYQEFVARLDTKGHPDDWHRKRRRKEWLLLPRYEEKARTFTQGQLTQTSQLARLAAQVVREPFAKLPDPPQLVALPGSVTGTVRKAWNVLGCLSAAAPSVMENITQPDGTTKPEVKTKTEIRDITHLHHALDAGVLALAAHFIPNRGDVWRLLAERRLNPAQQSELAALGLFDFDERGQFRLRDLGPGLKAQVRERLAERRVVQHVPADMSGLRVEENTRGIIKRENGRVFLHQRKKNADGQIVVNRTNEPEGKVMGLPRADGTGGKLAALNGVRVIDGNFGIAILDAPEIPEEERISVVRFFRVWQKLRELRTRNGGRSPRMLRNGLLVHVPRGSRAGTWRILSTKETEAYGIAIDLAAPDGIKLAKGNAPVVTLVRDGLQIFTPLLTGNNVQL